MALEDLTGAKTIDSLVATNPTSTDPKAEGDDHIRGVKNTIKNTFPNVAGVVTPTHTEMNFVDGVTSLLQTQLDAKGSTTSVALVQTNLDAFSALLIGMVAAFPLGVTPTGWLECDGLAIPGAHTALIALVGANTPDLRGEFIRGWDNGKGTDSGRAINSSQLDQGQGHWHTIQDGPNSGGTLRKHDPGDTNNQNVTDGGVNETINDEATTMVTDGNNGTPRIGDETRPRSVALMYCIKHD